MAEEIKEKPVEPIDRVIKRVTLTLYKLNEVNAMIKKFISDQASIKDAKTKFPKLTGYIDSFVKASDKFQSDVEKLIGG